MTAAGRVCVQAFPAALVAAALVRANLISVGYLILFLIYNIHPPLYQVTAPRARARGVTEA